MLTSWLAVALLAASWRAADACSCAPDHPQSHFCNSDFDNLNLFLEKRSHQGEYLCQVFESNVGETLDRRNDGYVVIEWQSLERKEKVIVGRVQKMFRGNEFYDTYKVKIRNVFKTTPKAAVALKSGRILTPSQDSLCGVTLKPRETYVITGHVQHLQAHINLCGYISKWRDVTPRQRKGFRMLYKQGCTCKVHVTRRRTKSPNTCVTSYDDCYERHGICLHDRDRRCRWTRAPALTRCLQMQHFNGTMT